MLSYIQSGTVQWFPGKGKNNCHRRFQGGINSIGQRYIVRNVHFEPSSDRHKDWVSDTLRDIDLAFRLRKPAVISTHRVNFMGGLSTENRDRGLSSLKSLLSEMLKRWPDIEFLDAVELGDAMSASGYLTLNVLIAGDFFPGGRLSEIASAEPEQVLRGFIDTISAADLALLNLETPLCEPIQPIEKTGPALYGNPESASFLARAGFGLLTLANNHIFDFGARVWNRLSLRSINTVSPTWALGTAVSWPQSLFCSKRVAMYWHY